MTESVVQINDKIQKRAIECMFRQDQSTLLFFLKQLLLNEITTEEFDRKVEVIKKEKVRELTRKAMATEQRGPWYV